MKLPTLTLRMFVACVGLVFTAATADAQTIYTWNNTGSDWNAAGSWTQPGPPGSNSLDTSQFNAVGTYGTVAITDPTWSSSPTAYGTLILAPTAQFTGWNFTSSGTLTELRLRTYGPATYTFSGPSVQDTPVGNGLVMDIGYGSTVAFTGNGAASARTFGINLNGGTLRLDNSTNNIADRVALFAVATGGNLSSNGGAINFIGNTNGSTETIEKMTLDPGYTRINVENHSTTSPTVLTFSAFGRSSTGTVNFANTGPVGQLGAAGNNPRIMLTGQAAGFIGGWAVANGTDFAFYDTTNGVRAASSTDYAQNYTTAIGTNLAQGQYGALNQSAGTATVTWSGASAGAGTGSFLRIQPGASGQTLKFAVTAGNTVNLNSIVLTGSRDYAITGNTGVVLSGSSAVSRYIGVLDPNVTLTFSLPIAFATVATVVKYGDGILDLTANMSGTGLIGSSSSTTMYLNGGVLRVNTNSNGSFPSGSGQVTSFRGGVLELTGTTPSFTRALGVGAGNVNWSNSSDSHGSGGFSAFGSNASINIGGTYATLTWGSTTNFLLDGDALTFGSTKSNATVTWQNAIDFGAPANGTYALREVKVTSGAGTLGDLTVLAGPITGAPNADLIKTGNGVLELDSLNTYQGNTLIQGGTLVVNGSLGAVGATKTGNVVVGAGARLGGTGTVSPDQSIPLDPKSVIVNPGGTIRGGTPVTSVGSDHVGTLTINSGVTINSSPTANGTLQFEANKTGPGTASASQIVLGAGYNLNLNPGAGNKFTINLMTTSVTTPLDLGQQYTLTLASVGTDGHIQLNGTSLADGTVIDQSNYVLNSSSFSFDPGYTLQVLGSDATGYNLTLSFQLAPVPEPAFALAFAAASLVLGARIRRAGGRREPAAHC